MEPASDVVILRQKLDQNASPILSKPLSAEKSFQTHKGNISHADIIGKRPRDVVKSSTGAEFRLHDVSLSNYVLLSRRLVTPVSGQRHLSRSEVLTHRPLDIPS